MIRSILRQSRVAAKLTQVGNGQPLLAILDRLDREKLVDDLVVLDTSSAIVGTAGTFEPLRKFIQTFISRSYILGEEYDLGFRTIDSMEIGAASYVTTTCSADHFAVIEIMAEPGELNHSISIEFMETERVANEVAFMAASILDGCSQACLQDPSQPIVNLKITVTAASWNAVDSRSSDFERVAREALCKIIESAKLTHLD